MKSLPWSAKADGLCGDLANLEGLTATVRTVAPDMIVNAAAYMAVDKAKSEPTLADLINVQAPGVLACEAAALGAWLVHYSTDYVFEGSGVQRWQEDAPTRPLLVYGRSKLAGEPAINTSGAKALMLRTSWVYAARGHNFAKTKLRLATERDALNVVADQLGAPTGAELIVGVTAHMLRQIATDQASAKLAGVYHLAAAGETSWHSFALRVGACPVQWRSIEDSARPSGCDRYRGLSSTRTMAAQFPAGFG